MYRKLKKRIILLVGLFIFTSVCPVSATVYYEKSSAVKKFEKENRDILKKRNKKIKIDKQLINKNYTKFTKIEPKYIVIHDTDNRSKGADAQANRDYFAYNKKSKASAHYIVDEKKIIQALEDTSVTWHCGDKVNYQINNWNSIGIELCVNSDGNFKKTMDNGVLLTKKLMKKYNIPKKNVIRHYDVTRKICPRMMIIDHPKYWTSFKKKLDFLDSMDLFEKEIYVINKTMIKLYTNYLVKPKTSYKKN